MTQTMDVDTTIALGRLFWRVKEKVVETFKSLGEQMPEQSAYKTMVAFALQCRLRLGAVACCSSS